ncbi:hypothetical protein FHU38_005296 [Saccharomonospora amisosensis]|uniref:Uncharacterized protein n=1 Tax=Saccharomonospora amisosensis TaxID=1128677 RepID=A0A7X5ZTE5_9PSEU|nr:hypothetical protein [Saccharomonospora amisosensis]NIJ14888.1 hypothetical protein [Saccharomonospora amisosensis]
MFVPNFHQQTPDGGWVERACADDLSVVYTNAALITTLASTAEGSTAVLPSSIQPGLTPRMIEALQPVDGARVLEIDRCRRRTTAALAPG